MIKQNALALLFITPRGNELTVLNRKQIASDLLSSHIWVGPIHDYRVMNGLTRAIPQAEMGN